MSKRRKYRGFTVGAAPVYWDPTAASTTSAALVEGIAGFGKTIAAQVLAVLAQRRGARLIEIDRGARFIKIDRGGTPGTDSPTDEATRCAERLGYPLARARGAYRPAMWGIKRIVWRGTCVIWVI